MSSDADAVPRRSGSLADRIRHVRHERSSFEPRFYERHHDFWPIARAASTFADRSDWPEPSEYSKAFATLPGSAPVVFELAPMRRRRPVGQLVVKANLYDAMIVLRGIVPTRCRMWHDYLNALVWATFPLSKQALHRRQHVAIERWIPEGATQLPNARTRELDALALVDEGGVLVLDYGTSQTTLLFGHALFEGLVFGKPAMISRSLVLDARGANGASGPLEGEAELRLADALLSATLTDPTRIVSSDELERPPLRTSPKVVPR